MSLSNSAVKSVIKKTKTKQKDDVANSEQRCHSANFGRVYLTKSAYIMGEDLTPSFLATTYNYSSLVGEEFLCSFVRTNIGIENLKPDNLVICSGKDGLIPIHRTRILYSPKDESFHVGQNVVSGSFVSSATKGDPSRRSYNIVQITRALYPVLTIRERTDDSNLTSILERFNLEVFTPASKSKELKKNKTPKSGTLLSDTDAEEPPSKDSQKMHKTAQPELFDKHLKNLPASSNHSTRPSSVQSTPGPSTMIDVSEGSDEDIAPAPQVKLFALTDVARSRIAQGLLKQKFNLDASELNLRLTHSNLNNFISELYTYSVIQATNSFLRGESPLKRRTADKGTKFAIFNGQGEFLRSYSGSVNPPAFKLLVCTETNIALVQATE